MPRYHGGFTLLEIISVIIISGIIAGITIVTLSGPVQQYLDSGRRAEMSSIADTALRYVIRELRTALPNSVRMVPSSCTGGANTTCSIIEFLPTSGGGRYLSTSDCASSCVGYALDATASAVSAFDVLGTIPQPLTPANLIIISATSASGVYSLNNAAQVSALSASTVSFAFPYLTSSPYPTFQSLPSQSDHFQVISTPVTYVCSIPANGVGGTLTRYWNYTTLPELQQPTPTSTPNAVLASNLSACSFSLSGTNNNQDNLVTVQITISETDSAGTVESLPLSDSAYIANTP